MNRRRRAGRRGGLRRSGAIAGCRKLTGAPRSRTLVHPGAKELHRKIEENFGLEKIRDQCANDADFKEVLLHCKDGRGLNKFIISDGFVYRANKLCILDSSVHLLLLQEAHVGGLMGHFGAKKTMDVLAARFFWPKMKRHVERFVAHCTPCQKAKSWLKPHSLYLPRPIPNAP